MDSCNKRGKSGAAPYTDGPECQPVFTWPLNAAALPDLPSSCTLATATQDGLSGNSRTAMVATVSGSSDQYHHSINTLKYADRAKEIKTHVVQVRVREQA